MSTDVVGLRALAEKAQPNEFRSTSGLVEWAAMHTALSPDVVLALLDEITTLRDEKDAAVREMHSRELHHFEEEQRSAQLDAALDDRDARIEAARKHIGFPGQACGPLDVRRAQEALSGPAVPVPQDNPEATHDANGNE